MTTKEKSKQSIMNPKKYMRMALRLSAKAGINGDVPIGCVIVYDGLKPESKSGEQAKAAGILPGTVIGRGYNKRNRDKSPLMHAEIIAIRQACKKLQDWRLEDCTMYVTLEPCPMCAGAIVQARVTRVVIGARNKKAGCCGSVLDMLHEPRFNHQALLTEGVLGDECGKSLSDFFKELREQKKAED